MIVYGDHSRRFALGEALAGARPLLPHAGIEAHGRLVNALIAAGQVAQALADEEFHRVGLDRDIPAATAAMRCAVALARQVGRSWDAGFAAGPATDEELFADLLAAAGPDRMLDLREPEGFAHYAVYPEGYWRAARAWTGGRGARVVGIRSIGTTLAAAVAAATDAPTPVTVRPVGPPFERRLALAPDLAADLTATDTGHIAVADEGPGLSGSSFGAVADALEQRGWPASRLAFFPSHPHGPGAMASPRHRARWDATPRFVTTFDDLVLAADRPIHRLESWVADLTGRALAPPEDVAGGRWRVANGAERADAPPADAPGERRKFLLRAERGTFLLKFCGLGRSGAERAALHGRLAAAGLVPELTGVRHGFTVEPWRVDLRPLAAAALDRRAVLDHLGRYLAVRAALPTEGRSGASLAALLDMTVANAREALGEAGAREAEARWRPRLAGLAGAVRPALTDNRLQPWEWLVAPDGRILKTDAVDHHAGHDLIGCQDIAWDIAGAGAEFDLDRDEEARLARAVGDATGRALQTDLAAFCALAYAGFQVGACALAAGRAAGADQDRWTARGLRFQHRLHGLLGRLPRESA